MGTLQTASLSIAAAVWAADRASVRAQRATARKRNLEAKIGARPQRADPECPRRDPNAGGRCPPKNSAHQANYAAFTEPHPASRMANPLSEWRPYAGTLSGPLLVAVERELSPNQTVARFDSPAKG
jgi:hypothetical protein